jgi:hypothetical protein
MDSNHKIIILLLVAILALCIFISVKISKNKDGTMKTSLSSPLSSSPLSSPSNLKSDFGSWVIAERVDADLGYLNIQGHDIYFTTMNPPTLMEGKGIFWEKILPIKVHRYQITIGTDVYPCTSKEYTYYFDMGPRKYILIQWDVLKAMQGYPVGCEW